MIDFKCPTCGKTLQVTETNAGKKARCPGCSAVFLVPDVAVREQDYDPAVRANPFVNDPPAAGYSAPIAGTHERVAGSAGWGDFFEFKRMITPTFIVAAFWLGAIGCVIAGLWLMVSSLDPQRMLLGVVVLLAGPIAWRIICEVQIVFFRMNETLTDIHNTLREQETRK